MERLKESIRPAGFLLKTASAMSEGWASDKNTKFTHKTHARGLFPDAVRRLILAASPS
jgi:hypothetical protein